jgi:hypothetical protein
LAGTGDLTFGNDEISKAGFAIVSSTAISIPTPHAAPTADAIDPYAASRKA